MSRILHVFACFVFASLLCVQAVCTSDDAAVPEAGSPHCDNATAELRVDSSAHTHPQDACSHEEASWHSSDAVFDELYDDILRLYDSARAAEAEYASELALASTRTRDSAHNLVHYLALRRMDLRCLQGRLQRAGLSSLGSIESHVMPSLLTLERVAARLAGREHTNTHPHPRARSHTEEDFGAGPRALVEAAAQLLGPVSDVHASRIMVTMPSEAATDVQFVSEVVNAPGFTLARINCAHDSPAHWAAMARNLRSAAASVGKHIKISFDLAGPKLRTNDMIPPPPMFHMRVKRNDSGHMVEAARFTVEIDSSSEVPLARGIRVIRAVCRSGCHEDVHGDAHVKFTDARGHHVRCNVDKAVPGQSALQVTCDHSVYIRPHTKLHVLSEDHHQREVVLEVVEVPSEPGYLMLGAGDRIRVVLGDSPGRVIDGSTPLFEVSVSIPEVFRDVRANVRIFFDDGKFSAVIEKVEPAAFECRVVHVLGGGRAKLYPEKGINLPDTSIMLPALTQDDLEALTAVLATQPDLISMSFTQTPGDVQALIAELERRNASHVGIVLKIETAAAFNALPRIMLAGMSRTCASGTCGRVGLMIARGDLGVELGFSRLSEVQEEILWLAEAARMPVIWATGVLDSLAHGGVPSRGEVTDAAAAARADAVMLNKGPYIVDAVRFLAGVVERMRDHVAKNMHLLRRLRVAQARA